MKKIIVTMAVIFSLTTSATFAYDGKDVNKSVMKSFTKEFAGATNASWKEVGSGIIRASFDYQGKSVSAFFDPAGNVIATSVNISEDHLPLQVTKALNEKYADYKKIEVIEYTMEDETRYLLTVAKDNNTVVLKVSATGSIEVYKK